MNINKNKKATEKRFNFNISSFNKKDIFFFDVTKYIGLLFKIFDMNELKLDEEQFEILLSEIQKSKDEEKNVKNKESINILPVFYDSLNNISYPDLRKTMYSINISNILNIIKKNNELPTLKKIAKIYKDTYNKTISISTISRILKNNLGMRYLRTVVKNPKLNEYNYLFMSFVFIKGLIRSIQFGLNIIFLDETGFMLENNNFYCWREKNVEFYGGSKKNLKKKLNLILGVDKSKIIAKYFSYENIDQNNFIEFITILSSNLGDERKKNSIIIMDNAAYHKTADVIKTFKKNKLKVLTIPPYKSSFNMTELTFRFLKNRTYKNLYNTIEEMKNEIINILEGDELEKALVKLYRETLDKYKYFINEYEKKDYNNIYDKIISGKEGDEIKLDEEEEDE